MSSSRSKHALFIFSPGSEAVESLILACALGAVNSGADIRLRMLETEGTLPGAIHDGYVPFRSADLKWADLLVLGLARPEKSLIFDQIIGWTSERTQPLTVWIFGVSEGADPQRAEALREVEERFCTAGVVLTDEAMLLSAGSLEDARSEIQKTGARLVAALCEARNGPLD
jgi:hypothetical protein